MSDRPLPPPPPPLPPPSLMEVINSTTASNSTVVCLEEDPPPPYSALWDAHPPDYFALFPLKANTGAVEFHLDNHGYQNRNNADNQRRPNADGSRINTTAVIIFRQPPPSFRQQQHQRKPFGALFVAWIDIILNSAVIAFLTVDLVKSKKYLICWVVVLAVNLPWLAAANDLRRSTDFVRSRNERKKLTEAWKTINTSLLLGLGIATVLVNFFMLVKMAEQRVFIEPLLNMLKFTGPYLVRLLFRQIVNTYIKAI